MDEFQKLLQSTSAYSGLNPLEIKKDAPHKPFFDTTSWDPFVEEIKDVDTYLRRKFRQDVTDKSTGLDTDGIRKLLNEIVADGRASGESWRITKAKCFAAQAERMAIDVSQFDWFPAISIWNRWNRPITGVYWGRAREIDEGLIPQEFYHAWQSGNSTGDWNTWQDFDHSVPDWRVILKLGFPGLKRRLEEIASAECGVRSAESKESLVGRRTPSPPFTSSRAQMLNSSTAQYPDPFYEGLRITADAILACIDRFISQGEKRIQESGTRLQGDASGDGTPDLLAWQYQTSNVEHRTSNSELSQGATRLEKEIASLKRLRAGAPVTAYDMLMFIWLYFIFSEHLDGIQCRSLTEIDVFITPFYEADIASGRTTEAEFREQFKHWLWQWGSISNYWNQPVGLGGTKADGTSEYNHVSKIVLEVMDECALTTPKFLAKIAPNTPEWAMDMMLDLARRHRSIAFIGEEPYRKSLQKWANVSDEECRTMVVSGCYEAGLRNGANGSGASHVNLLKPVETMLRLAASGVDLSLDDWGTFKAEYLRRLVDVTICCRKIAEWTEKALPEVNPADLMTLSTEHALKTHRDGYANGCPRGNCSGILMIGLGTAVDALLAVKEIVYEKKLMTVAELGEVMEKNWEGHEDLRRKMLRSKRKWGNDDQEANELGGELARAFSAQINGFSNARGGTFHASGHSARQFIEMGAKTGATPDGRKAGDEMSKNLSPTMGADTAGTTSLVMTLANSGLTLCDLPGDFPLDVMMHPSACAGQEGIDAMKAIVRLFHSKGGSVVQFTVFSAEELKDAQAHPEKYENLQVRVCGWNVRWNDLCKEEQDAYIHRAENIAY